MNKHFINSPEIYLHSFPFKKKKKSSIATGVGVRDKDLSSFFTHKLQVLYIYIDP
jgi:hypothetical protein